MNTNAAVVVWPGNGRGNYAESFETVSEAIEAVAAALRDGNEPSYALELCERGPRWLDLSRELEDFEREHKEFHQWVNARRVSA